MFIVLRSPRSANSLKVLERRSFVGSTLSIAGKPPGPIVQLRSYLTPKSRALPVWVPPAAIPRTFSTLRSSPASESLLVLPRLNLPCFCLFPPNWLSWLTLVKVDLTDLRLLWTANLEAVSKSDCNSITSLYVFGCFSKLYSSNFGFTDADTCSVTCWLGKDWIVEAGAD